MPRGGSENALFIFSCHLVCRSGCARCWICYTGMRERAKILHVLQKQETKKDEFSCPLHLVVFLRSNPSCVFSPVLEWLLQNRSQNDVRIMVFLLVLWLPGAVICQVPQSLVFREVLNRMLWILWLSWVAKGWWVLRLFYAQDREFHILLCPI